MWVLSLRDLEDCVSALETAQEPDWCGIYYDFLHWGLGASDPRFGVEFANQPDWLILDVWVEIKRRRGEEVNSLSRSVSELCAIAVNALNSFGGGKAGVVDGKEFLPFRIDDPNSPRSKLLGMIKPGTARIVYRLLQSGELPPEISRKIHSVPCLYEVLEGLNGY